MSADLKQVQVDEHIMHFGYSEQRFIGFREYYTFHKILRMEFNTMINII